MGKMWFRPKTVGYGTGLPIAWQGWAVLAVFLLAVLALDWFVMNYMPSAERLVVLTVGLMILVVAVLIIAETKTEGGWRWRN